MRTRAPFSGPHKTDNLYCLYDLYIHCKLLYCLLSYPARAPAAGKISKELRSHFGKPWEPPVGGEASLNQRRLACVYEVNGAVLWDTRS